MMRKSGLWVGLLFAVACSSNPAVDGGVGSDGGVDAGPVTPAAPYVLTPFASIRVQGMGNKPYNGGGDTTIDVEQGPFAAVTLVLDLVSPCYPFSKWTSDPPPSRENYPTDCDAFDRILSVSLDDPTADGGAPGLELKRSITPFGGPEHYEVDVTDVFNGLSAGSHGIHVGLGVGEDSKGLISGSDGSWYVSVQFKLTPGQPPRKVLAVQSLYSGYMHVATSHQSATFTAPPGTRSGRLEYLVSGHGGDNDRSSSCIGPADEFCKRTHILAVDGAQLASYVPWRTDCHCEMATGPFGSYCQNDPTGDPNSVAAPRANWCPGYDVFPKVFDGGAFDQPGTHTLTWEVDGMLDGGYATWVTSVTYFAYGQ